jgi:hypothetical protein
LIDLHHVALPPMKPKKLRKRLCRVRGTKILNLAPGAVYRDGQQLVVDRFATEAEFRRFVWR